MKKSKKKSVAVILTAALMAGTVMQTAYKEQITYGAEKEMIDYQFTGKDAATCGYAEGTLTFTAPAAATYYLYWADDTKALEGYYEIASMELQEGESGTFTFGYHTAIPAKATKMIAIAGQNGTQVKEAVAVYDIPQEKQLLEHSGKLLYTFNSYSDIHIDTEVYYTKSQENWKNALKFAVDTNTDFIVSAGDAVTNAKGFAQEWDVYEKILAESDYTNPVWETNGNHDMRDESAKDGTGVKEGVKVYSYKGNTAFNKATGTDSTVTNLNADKPYYYKIQETTGDVFIFMALENGYKPAEHDNFSKEQIEWLKDLLDTYYGTGVNVYIIQHATFLGYGPGDIWSSKNNGGISSYYKGHMHADGMKDADGNVVSGREQNTEFKKILDTYKEIIWMSGHTHEDFSLGNNYSDEQGNACHMIHNPAVVGTTYINERNELEYDSSSDSNVRDGVGLNSQGYYVETYENNVVYYGANLTEEKIYPAYCYIMEGARNSEPVVLEESRRVLVPVYEVLVSQKEMIAEKASLSEALTITKEMLEKYYTYASYDQYQELKKTYYTYKDNPLLTQDETAVLQLRDASNRLYAIVHRSTGGETIVSTDFALRYYCEGFHSWDSVDTYFSKKEDGTYSYTYTASSSNHISVNVYDTDLSAFYCLSSSTGIVFADGNSESYTLKNCGQTRGSSITVKGLNAGNKVIFLYDSDTHQLKVTFQQ